MTVRLRNVVCLKWIWTEIGDAEKGVIECTQMVHDVIGGALGSEFDDGRYVAGSSVMVVTETNVQLRFSVFGNVVQ